MSKHEPAFYAQGAAVFRAPPSESSMGFRLCVCDTEANAEPLALMLNQHLECQSMLQQLIDMIAPTAKAEMRLTQGLSSARLQAKQLLNRMLAP